MDFENWINGEVSKIRPHFRKESDLKIDVIKKCAPKLILFIEKKKLRKMRIIFLHRKLTLKVKYWHFLTLPD